MKERIHTTSTLPSRTSAVHSSEAQEVSAVTTPVGSSMKGDLEDKTIHAIDPGLKTTPKSQPKEKGKDKQNRSKRVTSITRARARKPAVIKTEKLINAVLERIANGESLHKVCSTPDMPTRKAFFEWVSQSSELRKRYELAMQIRSDYYMEEIVEIADNIARPLKVDGIPVVIDGIALTAVDAESVNHAKLQIDARKWYLSKLAPKKYG